ncbi:T9SS type A sorting domain-containing protein [Paracrocinitomix mangrovi]|uniref:T9SS type A sorting domain-containing protein n=1 Tax=Paracrocinitomix mangrovi TaxID=2862509 RepID=UPI001C8D251D|nr:T9SS type A sorting domain-containing protein [Paracrocinitomix mangrovi]UKN01148.1 T9SS type A sorting domain-containing protein [Paracrocinitomix mangrovi]
MKAIINNVFGKGIAFLAFLLFVNQGLAQPSNDDPCNAIPLTVGTSCSYSTYTNANATATSGVTAPGCASYSGGDVWFTVTVPAGGQVTIDFIQGVMTDGGAAAYSGNNCNSLNLLSCNDDGSTNGLMPLLTVTGQTPGSTLYIRVWEYGNNNNGTFGICATEPAGPPANDDCTGATPLTVNPDDNCGTTTAGTIESATASSQASGCSGTADDDVWFSFTATSTTQYIDLLNVSGSTTDLYHSVYSGTCGSIGSPISCSDPNSSTVSGLTVGNTYYVRVYSWTSTTGQTTDFDICIGTPPPPPPNDDCTGAISLPVNPDDNCGSTTAGTIGGATQSSQTNDCGGTADDDVWFSFTATSTTQYIDLLNVSGSTTDLYHSVYDINNCNSIGSALVCSDPNSSTVSGLTIGNTYYVRVFSWTSTAGQVTDFDICIGTPPPPPPNDDCTGAEPVTMSTTTCNYTSGTIGGATQSSQTNDCGGTADDDVWYSFVATSNTAIVSLTNVSGSTTDLYHSVYSGTCNSIGTAISCSDPNSSSITGLTIGNTYYVRVYSWTSTAGQTTDFDICIMETGACGTPATQDYCMAPALLTPGAGSFSANTSGTYTDDEPANLSSLFCGSIENNSWYEFVATSSTATFDFVSVTGCTSGIQAEVYDVTQDVNGCCTGFTSMSNCWNPSTATSGTVTATGLTVGQTYVLMVDGYGGDVCDFTVSNWTAYGILPVTLVDFVGMTLPDANQLSWVTKTETDNDHFNVLRSYNGMDFEKIGEIGGAGTTVAEHQYQFSDREIRHGKVYYKLEQVDYNGQAAVTETIVLNREVTGNGVVDIWPNPATEKLMVEINGEHHISGKLEVLDARGVVVKVINIDIEHSQLLEIDLLDLENGVYMLRYQDQTGLVQMNKFIKS